MKKYRILSLLLAGLMALALTCPALALDDPEPLAKAVIIVDGDHREVLYDFHAHERMYPASITKIMTSLVVLDAVDKGELTLDTQVTASAQAVDLRGNPQLGRVTGPVYEALRREVPYLNADRNLSLDIEKAYRFIYEGRLFQAIQSAEQG